MILSIIILLFILPTAGNNLTELEYISEATPAYAPPPELPKLDYALSATGVEEFRQLEGVDGSGGTIVILDTGIWATHVEFKNRDFNVPGGNDWFEDLTDGVDNLHTLIGGSYEYDEPYDGTTPLSQHGTQCAGIAAGQSGVAPGANLVVIKIGGSHQNMVDAFEYCLQWKDSLDIDIVSFSMGSYSWYGAFDTLSQAAEDLVAVDIVVVAAAGNFGDHPSYYTPSPANAPHVLTVGSFKCDGIDDETWAACDQSSTVGPTHPSASSLTKPDILGPSYLDAPESGTSYDYLDFGGSSCATPFVAGVVALWLEKAPSLANDADHDGNPDIKQLLMVSAGFVDGDDDPERDNKHGSGRIDAMNARIFLSRDISSSTSSAPQVITVYRPGSRSYSRFDEPIWPCETGRVDYYKLYVSSGLQYTITVTITTEDDVKVVAQIIKSSSLVSSRIVYPDSVRVLTYTQVPKCAYVWYIKILSYSNSGNDVYWGGNYDIRITISTSIDDTDPPPKPPPIL